MQRDRLGLALLGSPAGRGELSMGRTSTVYLLHFEPAYQAPIGATGRIKVAGHYLGSTAAPVAERLAEHLAGRGSPLVKAAVAAGSLITVVATAPGGRDDERQAKRGRHHARFCPLCSSSPKPLSAGGHRG